MTESSARTLTELYDAAEHNPDWQAVLTGRTRLHVAVMSEPFLSYVFVGKKTVESRFSINRIAPFGRVQPGDLVLMKAGSIIGAFTVAWVKFYDLAEHPLEDIATEYGDRICADADFWLQKSGKRYASLMGISDVRHLPPMAISKADRRAWLTLEAA